MADPEPVNVTVTVTVTVSNPDPDNHTATFQYSGIDGTVIRPETGVVTLYEFTRAPESKWTPAPFTPSPAASWLLLDDENWTVTVDGTHLEHGASAGFRVTVVLDSGSYVDDPTIIMVEPPT